MNSLLRYSGASFAGSLIMIAVLLLTDRVFHVLAFFGLLSSATRILMGVLLLAVSFILFYSLYFQSENPAREDLKR